MSPRPLPLWSVYRRVDRDGGAHLDPVGVVAAEFHHQAVALAALLPDAPKSPVLCHAAPGRVPTLTLVSRRNKKRLVASAIIGSTLALAGCNEPTADEVARARAVLPPACKIYEVGSYGGVRDMVVVVCPEATTTTLFQHSSGKTTGPVAIVSRWGRQ